MPQRTPATLVFCSLVLCTVAIAAQPTLVWETTLSATTELEGADDLVVDANGNSIVLGYLPVERDFYILKFDDYGAFVWSRTIGGAALDYVNGVVVDDVGDIYLTGRTVSADFPVVNAYQATLNGNSDAFLMKLRGGDGATVFSTYFGGSRGEWGSGIDLGPNGEITIAGRTDSADFETVNPIQANLTLTQCFCEDLFVTRFSAAGDQVLFSTYLGGSFDDYGVDVRVDAAGNTYFTGLTKSADFPSLNAMQPQFGGGEYDTVVGKIDATDLLEYSTYLGGEDWDLVMGLEIDDEGSAYVTGSTRSIGFPTTPGAFQETFVGGINACEVPFGSDYNCEDFTVTKFDAGGTFAYSTFVGGNRPDEPRNLVVDEQGRAIVTGYTYSDNFPMGAPFGTVVVFRLKADGSNLDYVLVHDSPGSNAGSAVAIQGSELFTSSSVGLPYDTYIARHTMIAGNGDADEDGDVDLADAAVFFGCAAGPGILHGGCPDTQFNRTDFDDDGDADLADFAILQANFGS